MDWNIPIILIMFLIGYCSTKIVAKSYFHMFVLRCREQEEIATCRIFYQQLLTTTISTIYNYNCRHKYVVLECDFPPRITVFERVRAAFLPIFITCISIYGPCRNAVFISRRLCSNASRCEVCFLGYRPENNTHVYTTIRIYAGMYACIYML